MNGCGNGEVAVEVKSFTLITKKLAPEHDSTSLGWHRLTSSNHYVHMTGELKHNIHDLFLSTSSHSRSIAFSFGIPKHNTKRHRRATADHGNS